MPEANHDNTTPDAALLKLCAEFHRLHAVAYAMPREADEAEMAAALDRRWAASDQIATIPATTDAGRRAKAAVASALLDEWGALETSHTIIFARNVLRDIGGAGGLDLDQTPNPDAELIRLCERIVANRAEDEAICTADPHAPDGGPNHVRLEELWADYATAEAQIFELPEPTTAQGAKAAARASLACAPRDAEGEITAGEDLDTWLAFACVEWLAGSAVA
jgi:hypothetical protein